jgi:UDP-2-acetamido-2-deoxy-ribo-hexuluronate aminotransferase
VGNHERRALGDRYRAQLADVPGVDLLAVRDDRDCVWAQYTVFVDDRTAVQAALKAQGIPTAVHYPKPVHHQTAYARYAAPDDLPHSVAAGARVLSLPMSADLTPAQQDRVVRGVAIGAVTRDRWR